MKRTRTEDDGGGAAEAPCWPGNLPDEIWRVEILGKHLDAAHWPRTRVMLRRTCRWFATHVHVAPVALDMLALVDETDQLASRREWWPTLGLQLHLGDASWHQFYWRTAMATMLRRGALPAFWLTYSSLPTRFFSDGLARLGVFPDTWWAAAVESKQLRILEHLWDHAPSDQKCSRELMEHLLTCILGTRDRAMYDWLTSLPRAYWRAFMEYIPLGMWHAYLDAEYMDKKHGPLTDPIWAQGFVRVVPKDCVLTESRWERINDWASHRQIASFFTAGTQ